MKLFLNSKLNRRISIITMIFFFVTVLISNRAYSHGDHDPPPTFADMEAIEKATKDVSLIVDQSESVEGMQLDGSWKQIPKRDKHVYERTDNYVIVSFKKSREKTLYVLLTIYGRYLAANFSGKF